MKSVRFVTVAFLLAFTAFASPTGAAITAEQRAFVKKTLASIKPFDDPSYDKAVAALLGRVAALLPAIQEAMKSTGSGPYLFNWPLQALVEAANDIRVGRNTRLDVDRWLSAHHINAQQLGLRPVPIRSDAAATIFPRHAFFSLVVRQWPIGFNPPPPLKVANILAVFVDGRQDLVTDPADLAGFFKVHLHAAPKPPATATAIRTATIAWLDLTQVFSEDGYFIFITDAASVSVYAIKTGFKCTGTVKVSPEHGDHGQIAVTLAFRTDGTFLSESEKRNVFPGVRPICQATKLLDPDPIVRRMAQRDLLILGVSAQGYLLERRAESPAPLQQAIDEIWRQIVERQQQIDAPASTSAPPRQANQAATLRL